MPARHRHHHSSKRQKAFTITLESLFTFIWNPRSRCVGNRVHLGPEYAAGSNPVTPPLILGFIPVRSLTFYTGRNDV
jgi:hypothetical protein